MIPRLAVQQYRQLMQAGILLEGAPIELIDGLLVYKNRRDAGDEFTRVGVRHASSVSSLYAVLRELVSACPAHVAPQQPVTLDEFNEPEPDISVVGGQIDDYHSHHPGPADVVLVIEVADSSLTYDRTTKHRLYAVAGIPLYWIVDLTQSRIEVYERPNPQQERYESVVGYGIGDAVPFAIGSQTLELKVGDVL